MRPTGDIYNPTYTCDGDDTIATIAQYTTLTIWQVQDLVDEIINQHQPWRANRKGEERSA